MSWRAEKSRRYDGRMRDLMFVAVVVGFFFISVLFVRTCAVVAGREGTNEDRR